MICNGVVKPPIVFVGEDENIVDSTKFEGCDLIIYIGTSMNLFTFNFLSVDSLKSTPAVLINPP